MRPAAYGVLLFLSLAVAGYAIGVYGFMPVGALVSPEMRSTYEAERVGIYAHVFGASVAMALGPFQFSSRLRARRPSLHRWMGRLYDMAIAYPIIAWLCWVPNLLLAELWFNRASLR